MAFTSPCTRDTAYQSLNSIFKRMRTISFRERYLLLSVIQQLYLLSFPLLQAMLGITKCYTESNYWCDKMIMNYKLTSFLLWMLFYLFTFSSYCKVRYVNEIAGWKCLEGDVLLEISHKDMKIYHSNPSNYVCFDSFKIHNEPTWSLTSPQLRICSR